VEAEAKAQQAQKNAEVATGQRDALQAQLKDTEAKVQQFQKNAEVAVSQRDGLQAQLKTSEEKPRSSVRNLQNADQAIDQAHVQQDRRSEGRAAQMRDLNATYARSEQTQPANPDPNPERSSSAQPLGLSVQSAESTAIFGSGPVRFPGTEEGRSEQNRAPAEETAPIGANAAPIPIDESVTRNQVPAELGRSNQNQTAVPSPTGSAETVAESVSVGVQNGSGVGASTEDSSVKEFVLDYIRTVAIDDVSKQERFFAQRVNFFSEGALSLQSVQASTERYHRKWPIRDWEPQGEPEILRSDHPRQYEVLQPITWKVSNGLQHHEGSATLYIRIVKNEKGEFHIVHVEQRSGNLATDRPASQESQPPSTGQNAERRRSHSH
jgi:hypothetical protein